jgi:hypothetical protein
VSRIHPHLDQKPESRQTVPISTTCPDPANHWKLDNASGDREPWPSPESCRIVIRQQHNPPVHRHDDPCIRCRRDLAIDCRRQSKSAGTARKIAPTIKGSDFLRWLFPRKIGPSGEPLVPFQFLLWWVDLSFAKPFDFRIRRSLSFAWPQRSALRGGPATSF